MVGPTPVHTSPTLMRCSFHRCYPMQIKIIDFGAAVDMCTGINFNPLYGMLDPRYSPPEELVMPKGGCERVWEKKSEVCVGQAWMALARHPGNAGPPLQPPGGAMGCI